MIGIKRKWKILKEAPDSALTFVGTNLQIKGRIDNIKIID
jgi:hypothetical protein